MRVRRTNQQLAEWLDSIIGQKFGMLTIIKHTSGGTGRVLRKAECRCDCGNIKEVRIAAITCGKAKSCGCKRHLRPAVYRCSLCKQTFPFDADHFASDKKTIHGLKCYCRGCSGKYTKKYSKRIRIEALVHYSGGTPKCSCCSLTELEFLCLDHINNDGKEDRKKWGLGSRFYRMLKRENYPPYLQVLCFNCNFAKSVYGECPHHKQRRSSEKTMYDCL